MPMLNDIPIVPRARRGLSRNLLKKGPGQRQGWILFTTDDENLFIGGANYEAVPVSQPDVIRFTTGESIRRFTDGKEILHVTYFDA